MRQIKDFKSNVFGCVASKGLRGVFFGSVANKGVSGKSALGEVGRGVWKGRERAVLTTKGR